MTDSILELVELGMPWTGLDPFIFTVHHVDHYPAGDDAQGPVDSLTGRNIGSDFSSKDGWSMYHGDHVPGFPQHPHRGFETVTVVRRGYVDHSDSLGATARYGGGDTQWLTTGSGIMHAEMFPLIDKDGPNPLELFQIWLNLPPESKMVPAHFAMLWSEEIPTVAGGPGVSVDIIAGEIGGVRASAPPPDSWAAQPRLRHGDLVDSPQRRRPMERACCAPRCQPDVALLRRRRGSYRFRVHPTADGGSPRSGTVDQDHQSGAPGRVLAAAGPADRSARLPDGSVRDEHPRAASTSFRRLSPHPVRWLAVAESQPRSRSPRRPIPRCTSTGRSNAAICRPFADWVLALNLPEYRAS